MKALDLATLLGQAGAAVSPEGSWQQRTGEAASEMASAEQDRRFLSDLLGGGIPDPTGRHGLSPEVVLRGLQLRHQIEQSRPEQIEMAQVETPWETTETMPAEDVPEYRRKIWSEQRDTVPSGIRTFKEFQQMDETTQKDFLEFSKGQRGKNFEEALAEYLTKRKEAAKQEKKLEPELEFGTAKHIQSITDNLDPMTVSKGYAMFAERAATTGMKRTREQFVEAKAIAEAERQMEDRMQDVTNVRYKTGPEGEGFYGITKEGGLEILLQKYQRRYPVKIK